jgi:hypothetical protein
MRLCPGSFNVVEPGTGTFPVTLHEFGLVVGVDVSTFPLLSTATHSEADTQRTP